MWTYLKCVYWNKLTLLGYLLFLVACVGFVYLPKPVAPWLSIPMIFISGCLLIATFFGIETMQAYQRTKKALEKNKEPQITDWSAYCGTTGVKAAFRENNRRQRRS